LISLSLVRIPLTFTIAHIACITLVKRMLEKFMIRSVKTVIIIDGIVISIVWCIDLWKHNVQVLNGECSYNPCSRRIEYKTDEREANMWSNNFTWKSDHWYSGRKNGKHRFNFFVQIYKWSVFNNCCWVSPTQSF
jgi:hypothetical protein